MKASKLSKLFKRGAVSHIDNIQMVFPCVHNRQSNTTARIQRYAGIALANGFRITGERCFVGSNGEPCSLRILTHYDSKSGVSITLDGNLVIVSLAKRLHRGNLKLPMSYFIDALMDLREQGILVFPRYAAPRNAIASLIRRRASFRFEHAYTAARARYVSRDNYNSKFSKAKVKIYQRESVPNAPLMRNEVAMVSQRYEDIRSVLGSTTHARMIDGLSGYTEKRLLRLHAKSILAGMDAASIRLQWGVKVGRDGRTNLSKLTARLRDAMHNGAFERALDAQQQRLFSGYEQQNIV